MKLFFELDAELQAEQVLEAIRIQKANRKDLIGSKPETDPFLDLYWKLKEVEENNNPIPIPHGTRLRFVKRVIGKLIQPFTRKQVHFNQSTTSYLSLVLLHFRKLSDENRQLIQVNEMSTEKLSQSLVNLNDELTMEQQKLTQQNELKFTEIDQRFTEFKEIFDEGSIRGTEAAVELKKWVEALETSHKNLENWVSIINKRTEATEAFQDRMRKEIYAELKYTNQERANSVTKASNDPRILNQEKLTALLDQDEFKVNLGCGMLNQESYINVDMRELPGVDVVADARNLPFQKGIVKELYLSHIIEHFPDEELKKVILPHWYSAIKRGGKIHIICPNWEAMLDGYNQGIVSYEELKEVTFGSQEYEGNYHFTMFTPETLKYMLMEAGFANIQIITPARRNGLCFEMEVEGEKV